MSDDDGLNHIVRAIEAELRERNRIATLELLEHRRTNKLLEGLSVPAPSQPLRLRLVVGTPKQKD